MQFERCNNLCYNSIYIGALYFIDNLWTGELIMPVNYDKLWKILEERKMMKTELVRAAKISTNAMAKLGKNEDVRFEILVKICHTLDVRIDDIVDYGMDGK